MEDRTCCICGAPFTPLRRDSVCCSLTCSRRRNRDSATRKCSVAGCDKPHRAKGLCAAHYVASRPSTMRPEATRCTVCGKEVNRFLAKSRNPTCSYRCRYVLRYGKDIADGREVVGPVPYRATKRVPTVIESPVEPKLRFVAGYCAHCGDAFVHDQRTTGIPPRFCSEPCGKAWHKAAHRRRQGQFKISPRARRALYERDGWTCQLCGASVDPALHPSHPMAATLDHIECQSWALVPDHSDANLRLAHRMCNSLRGDHDHPTAA